MNGVILIEFTGMRGAFFDDKAPKDPFYQPLENFPKDQFKTFLKNKQCDAIFISTTEGVDDRVVMEALNEENIKFSKLAPSDIKINADSVPKERLINCYGALAHFPTNDCIVIDVGQIISFDLIGKDGSYLDGAVFPGLDLTLQALKDYKNSENGPYLGILGAIERISYELILDAPESMAIKIIATGQALRGPLRDDFLADLKELVDHVDPHLTLVGLNELLKENKNGEQK